jgi:hypothetical protein
MKRVMKLGYKFVKLATGQTIVPSLSLAIRKRR